MIKLNAVIKWITASTMGLAVICPFCSKIHHHGSGGQFKAGDNGHRVSDCSGCNDNEGYCLNITEVAIEDARNLFYDRLSESPRFLKDRRIQELFEKYNDEEPDKEIFGAPVLNAVIKSKGKDGKLWGLLVICPFCGEKHSHGDEIKKPGIYGLRVGHCKYPIVEDRVKDEIYHMIKQTPKWRDSYWLNVKEEAFIQARSLKKNESLYSKENKVRLLFSSMNGYKPSHFDIAKFRYSVLRRRFTDIDYKSQYLESKKSHSKQRTANFNTKTYFILCEHSGMVKIGTSVDPEKRLCGLQTSNPFPLKIIKITELNERELHHRFHHHRKSGEWFEFSDEIKQFIASL